MRYSACWPVYARQWDHMRIKPARVAEFRGYGEHAVQHRDIYEAIQEATAHDGLGREGDGVPWFMIAALHRRESDCDFTTYLGNGQSLSKKTTLVPKGRGPFPDFKTGAIDALAVDGLSSVLDWRLEKMLYFSELFNGPGYYNRGLPSPYVFGGTNIQAPGKFREDKRGSWFAKNEWDKQPGVAPLILAISQVSNDVARELIRESV